jgi:hypothetical protein
MDGVNGCICPKSRARNVLPPQPAEVINLSSILVPWLFLYCMACGPSDYGGISAATDCPRKSAGSNAPDAGCQDALPTSLLALLLDDSAHPNLIVTKPEPASPADKSGFTLLNPTPRSLMAEFDLDRNDRNDGYGVDFVHSATIGHELFTEKLIGYVEYVGIAPMRTSRTYLVYFDTGVTQALSKDMQWDAGITVGLSRRADDLTVFAGLSFRR